MQIQVLNIFSVTLKKDDGKFLSILKQEMTKLKSPKTNPSMNHLMPNNAN